MPSHATARLLVDEAAIVLSRGLSETDREAAAAVWERQLSGLTDHDLEAAVDRWIATRPDGQPVFALPTRNTLISIHRGTQIAPDSTESRPHKAGRSFVQAQAELGRIMAGIWKGSRPPHTCRDRDFDPETGCDRCRRTQKIRDLIAEAAEAAPRSESPGPSECLCRGTGWIDPPELTAAVYTTRISFDNRARVSPCPEHGPRSETTPTPPE